MKKALLIVAGFLLAQAVPAQLIKKLGDKVKAGDPIADIDSRTQRNALLKALSESSALSVSKGGSAMSLDGTLVRKGPCNE